MFFLSQLLEKKIYYNNGKILGKIEDVAIFQNRPHPPICKIEIKIKNKKITVSPQALVFEKNKFILKNNHAPFLPYDHTDFYLSEDLLDKQIIDTVGKRLLRVNDVALETNGEIKVIGIDVSFPGILRRLGFGNFTQKSKIIPWNEIEAFDYQTGAVKIKSVGKKLNALHPSELAEILEDVGNKERIGIIEALDSQKAARAIEETNDETLISILETLPVEGSFKDILNKIKISELADVFLNLNASKKKDIQNVLTREKVDKVNSLLLFSNQTAGGMMHINFIKINENETVAKAMRQISNFEEGIPEVIVLIDEKEKYKSVIKIKNFIAQDPETVLANCPHSKIFINTDYNFNDILKLFSRYNLRGLAVVDSNQKPIGVVMIDDVLSEIAKQKEENEII